MKERKNLGEIERRKRRKIRQEEKGPRPTLVVPCSVLAKFVKCTHAHCEHTHTHTHCPGSFSFHVFFHCKREASNDSAKCRKVGHQEIPSQVCETKAQNQLLCQREVSLCVKLRICCAASERTEVHVSLSPRSID